jgi:hypothetical protein
MGSLKGTWRMELSSTVCPNRLLKLITRALAICVCIRDYVIGVFPIVIDEKLHRTGILFDFFSGAPGWIRADAVSVLTGYLGHVYEECDEFVSVVYPFRWRCAESCVQRAPQLTKVIRQYHQPNEIV